MCIYMFDGSFKRPLEIWTDAAKQAGKVRDERLSRKKINVRNKVQNAAFSKSVQYMRSKSRFAKTVGPDLSGGMKKKLRTAVAQSTFSQVKMLKTPQFRNAFGS